MSHAAPVTHRRMLGIAIPMTIAHLSTPMVGLVNTAVIGQLGEAHLLGAIAVGALIFDFLFWSFGFLRMGTAAFTSQALGAGDAIEREAALLRAVLTAAAFGALLIAAQAPLAAAAFTLLGASEAVTGAARAYFDARIWSAPFALANYAILGWFIGLGRAGTGLALQVVLNLANMLFNILLVLGLGWSVEGAAIGALLGEIAACLTGLILAGRALGWRLATPRSLIFDRARLLRLAVVNRDILIRTLALISAFAFFTVQGARADDVTLAGNAVLYNLFLAAGLFLDGLATAAEQIGGQAIGARDLSAFRRTVRIAIVWGYGLAALASLFLLAAGPMIIDMITTQPEVRAAARLYLPWAALTPLAAVLAFQFDGVFIGATWTAAMRNMMLLSLALYIAAFWALAPMIGNHGLWIAFNLFLFVRGITLLWAYPREMRRTFSESVDGLRRPAGGVAADGG